MMTSPTRIGAAFRVAIRLPQSARPRRRHRLSVLCLGAAGQADLAEQAALLLRLGLGLGGLRILLFRIRTGLRVALFELPPVSPRVPSMTATSESGLAVKVMVLE